MTAERKEIDKFIEKIIDEVEKLENDNIDSILIYKNVGLCLDGRTFVIDPAIHYIKNNTHKVSNNLRIFTSDINYLSDQLLKSKVGKYVSNN